MSNKSESLVFADDRPSSLDDTLYQWAVDAEDMIREMQKHIDDLNKENSMQDKRSIENIVQEIMGLVDEYVNAEIDYRIALNIDVGVRSAEKYSYEAESLLESKLRELVESSFSVREPLSDKLPKGFLADVVTAAGLVKHGKQSKALGERLASEVMQIRTNNITKDS